MANTVTLPQLFSEIWRQKFIVIGCVAVFIVLAVLYVLVTPKTYESSVKVLPNQESSEGLLSSLAQNFGGLASMAGIDVSESSSKTVIAKELLTSRQFITEFAKTNQLYPYILAVKSWTEEEGFTFDSDIWDDQTGWNKEKEWTQTEPALDNKLFEDFTEKMRISENEETGVIKLSFVHQSPEFAKRTVSAFFNAVNEYLRALDQKKAERKLTYLDEQVKQNRAQSLETVLYALLEQEMQKLMLTEVEEEYAFVMVEPAYRPTEPYAPRVVFALALSIVLGGILGVFITLIRISYRLRD